MGGLSGRAGMVTFSRSSSGAGRHCCSARTPLLRAAAQPHNRTTGGALAATPPPAPVISPVSLRSTRMLLYSLRSAVSSNPAGKATPESYCTQMSPRRGACGQLSCRQGQGTSAGSVLTYCAGISLPTTPGPAAGRGCRPARYTHPAVNPPRLPHPQDRHDRTVTEQERSQKA